MQLLYFIPAIKVSFFDASYQAYSSNKFKTRNLLVTSLTWEISQNFSGRRPIELSSQVNGKSTTLVWRSPLSIGPASPSEYIFQSISNKHTDKSQADG